MSAKSFASQHDLTDKNVSFVELGAGARGEVSGVAHPRIWTAARDQEMWRALEA